MPAGAADGHGDEVLALVAVTAEHGVKHIDKLVEEITRPLPAEHVVAHRLVGAAESAQLRDPIRVGQEADVHHEVGVLRGAVLEAEGLERDVLAVVRHRAEGRLDGAAQVVHRQAGGVDDDVGEFLDPVGDLALALQAQLEGVLALQRVGAPHAVEAADEHVVAGVHEQHGGAQPLLRELPQRRPEVAAEEAGADVEDEGDLLHRRILPEAQLQEIDDELRGKVLDHEEPLVLQHLRRRTEPSAGHAGDEDGGRREAGRHNRG